MNKIKNIIFIFTTILLFLSCDKSFEEYEPFSYKTTSSKVDGKCKIDSDCKKDVEICDIDNSICVINPCYDVKCGGKGSCTINKEIKDENDMFLISCKCDLGYQDNDNDKVCDISCSHSDVCLGKQIRECNDLSGKIDCGCDEDKNWYQNTKSECLNPCENSDCKLNEKCVASGPYEYVCECDEYYFLNEDHICESPCEGHWDCGGYGKCIAESLNEAHCDCNYGSNLSVTNPALLTCFPDVDSPCNGVNCGLFGKCKVNQYYQIYCACNEHYQDNNHNMICAPECNFDCGGSEKGYCNDLLYDFNFCECNDGYHLDGNYNCIED